MVDGSVIGNGWDSGGTIGGLGVGTWRGSVGPVRGSVVGGSVISCRWSVVLQYALLLWR